jgi:hypothetical protein
MHDVHPLADLIVRQGGELALGSLVRSTRGWSRASSRSLVSKNRESKRMAG